MKKNPKKYGSDFAKFDKHILEPEEYDEAPELTDEALDRGKFFCGNSHIEVAAHVPEIRAKTSMTQEEFADTFGFSLSALRKWEQGTRVPTGAAMALLTIIERNPDAALDALRH